MKILYIANARIPTEKAHGFQIMKTCEAFALHHVDLTLILPIRRNPSYIRHDPFSYYQVRQLFSIKKLLSFDPYWFVSLSRGVYIKFQASLFMLSLLFSLLFRVDRKDCIFYTRDEYILPLLQKFSDQVIWEGHTIPKHTYYYVRYWKRCRKIIAISRGLKNELIQLGIREDKILVAPDGVDLNEFKGITRKKEDARTRLNLPLDSDIVLYNGHLYQWKGAHVLAEAAQFLGGNETVIFCGGTVKEVEEFKTRYKDVKNVIIAGHRPRKEIPLYLKSADVFVLPNSARERISRVYTSPIKLFEYMAARRPIVASDIPAVREILDETSAIFVSPDNPRALAAGIKEALKNRERSHKIAENAYKRVQRFTWIERTHHILSFLRI